MLIDQENSGFVHVKTHPRQLGIPLSRRGRNLISSCPFHAPEETSLFFYDALGYWRYRCLQCGSEGDLVEFVMRSRFNAENTELVDLAAAVHNGYVETGRKMDQLP